MTIHRAAPQQERAVRAPGPDDQQRTAINSAEAGNHPSGWKPEPACHVCVLSCPCGHGLFRKPRQPPFAGYPAAQYLGFQYHAIWSWGIWSWTRAVHAATDGAQEFSP